MALSTFEFCNTAGRPLNWEDVENGPPILLTNKNSLGNSKLVNGLVVRESEGAFERVAAFRIDSKVWEAEAALVLSTTKTVYLR